MLTRLLRARTALVLVLLTLTAFIVTTLARPRPPLPPYPEMELRGWRFDNPAALDAVSLHAFTATNLQVAESWSGYALDMSGPDPRALIIPAMAATNRFNFARSNGTLRLWFAPAWTSTSLGGDGPGQWATLFELSQTNEVKTPFSLALALDPDGTNLIFFIRTNAEYVAWLRAPVRWWEGEWHQLALVYDRNGVNLVIDDVWAASSKEVPPWPGSSVWSQSVFSLGGNLAGGELAQGQLDEIHTFAYALPLDYLVWMYEAFSPIAALGPILEKNGKGLQGGGTEAASAPSPCETCSTNDPGPSFAPPVPGFSFTSGLRFAPSPYLTSNGTGYVTWLLGTNVGERYEIYQTTNLLGTSVWNSVWSRVATGGVSFILSHPTNDGAKAFYLAATYADVDGDGISDAYEYLVLRATNLWDFDSDGMPDFWEIAHGLNYTNRNDATNDMDGDGIKNLSEYLYEASLINRVEPLGPSSRRTPLVITEIMYHPAPGGTEFIELHNTHHLPQKLDGFRFIDNSDGSVLYIFTNTTLAPGMFLSVTPTNLPTPAQLQLRNNLGAVLLEVEFSDKTPWPKTADGTGHSLVLSRPSYGENDVQAWSPSARIGGSPGSAEPVIQDFKAAMRINEFLAYPAGTNMDFIELYNASSVTQNLSGWHLATKATNLVAYTFRAGTLLPPRGFLSQLRNAANAFTFGLEAGGDSIFLTTADGKRVVDAVDFLGQEQGVSTGRSPDGGPVFRELAAQTRGGTNAPPLLRNIVINEIMYNPISGNNAHEYVELYNRGTTNQSLTGWSLAGGLTFSFPSFVLAPSNYVVIAQNTNTLSSLYPGRFTNRVNLLGGYGGFLGNNGERLTLLNSNNVVINEVAYSDGGRWGRWSDGDGSSLELVDPRSDNRLAANWADSDETQKSGTNWTLVAYTNILDHSALAVIDRLDFIQRHA